MSTFCPHLVHPDGDPLGLLFPESFPELNIYQEISIKDPDIIDFDLEESHSWASEELYNHKNILDVVYTEDFGTVIWAPKPDDYEYLHKFSETVRITSIITDDFNNSKATEYTYWFDGEGWRLLP